MMRRAPAIALALCLLLPTPLHALTDEEIFRGFRFNFINPGARSLALGGAFVSLADDATAAQANPAGIGFLARSEYFAELRSVDDSSTASVRRESLPAGIDTFSATGLEPEDTISPSFLSVVTTYPETGRRRVRWAQGISRQEVINVSNATVSSLAFTFPSSPGAFIAEGDGSIDVSVANVNVSVGVRATDRLGLGATLTWSRLDVRSRVENRIVDTVGGVAGQELLEPTLDLRTGIDDTDDDVTFGLGLIYRADRWGLGAVYRRGAKFTVVQTIDPARDLDGDGTIDEGLDVFGVRQRLGQAFGNRVHLPDAYGVRVHGSLLDQRLTIAAGVERIEYTDLLDGYVAGVNPLHGPDAEFDVSDATEGRLGAEYVFGNLSNVLPPMGLRAGVFTESDSTIRGNFSGGTALVPQDSYPGRANQTHLALGLGFNWARFKLDVAADFSQSKNEYLVSIIFQEKNR